MKTTRIEEKKEEFRKSFSCLFVYWSFGAAFGLGFYVANKLMKLIYG